VDHQKTTPAGNCFVAGTKVATDHGEINIEEITEGTRVLTEAATARYGVASDEDVVTPPVDAKIPLVGFSESTPNKVDRKRCCTDLARPSLQTMKASLPAWATSS
jgi:hypothetical protein